MAASYKCVKISLIVIQVFEVIGCVIVLIVFIGGLASLSPSPTKDPQKQEENESESMKLNITLLSLILLLVFCLLYKSVKLY